MIAISCIIDNPVWNAHVATNEVFAVTAAQEGLVGNTRRTRTKVSAKAVKDTAQVADEGAECKQS